MNVLWFLGKHWGLRPSMGGFGLDELTLLLIRGVPGAGKPPWLRALAFHIARQTNTSNFTMTESLMGLY